MTNYNYDLNKNLLRLDSYLAGENINTTRFEEFQKTCIQVTDAVKRAYLTHEETLSDPDLINWLSPDELNHIRHLAATAIKDYYLDGID